MPGFSENPFASPLSSSAPSAPAATMTDRAGPPWERDGASLASFIGTLKQLYTSPSAMFSEMLRGGSLWMPLGFAICGGMCGGLFNLIYDAVLPDPFQNPGIGGPNAGPGAGPGGALVFPCFLVIGPLIISAIVLVLALIMHGILLALGGAISRSSQRSARSPTAGVGPHSCKLSPTSVPSSCSLFWWCSRSSD